MINGNAQNTVKNYMIIHVVLSRSAILYLKLNKLGLPGDLGFVEDQCQEDASIKYLFYYWYQFT